MFCSAFNSILTVSLTNHQTYPISDSETYSLLLRASSFLVSSRLIPNIYSRPKYNLDSEDSSLVLVPAVDILRADKELTVTVS